jgi:nitroimidazol reductase NimA-like FMN-containing flavoprotein (pyridoxamine 5'-phosphate oxidase superfamily)
MTIPAAPSQRTTVRRGANRAVYEVDRIRAILDAGVIAHVGVTTDDGPIVLPMAYGVRQSAAGGAEILIHGAVANAMMRAGESLDVCLTVTIVDGLVVARTPFHNSMNYRSVVVRGTATAIREPGAKIAALKVINDHVAPIWGTARPPSDSDVRKTLVLAVPLVEASAKVRGGDPIDEEIDMDGPYWAGVVPLTSTWGDPVTAGDLRVATEPPPPVRALGGTNAHPPTR